MALPKDFFAKAIDTAGSQAEVAAVDAEIKMYEMLARLGLTGEFFPEYKGSIVGTHEHVLLLEYLEDVSWEAPWSVANIQKLASSITRVHETRVSDSEAEAIKDIADDLSRNLAENSESTFDSAKKDVLFHQAWQSRTGFVNSRGQGYYTPKSSQSVDMLLQAEQQFDEKQPRKLILKDLNFGNMAVARDKVYFVDPVYMNIGNPAFDLTVLGINLLRHLPQDNNEAHRLVKDLFLNDRPALAFLTKYWVACTQLPIHESQVEWMNFQQSCAATALHGWED